MHLVGFTVETRYSYVRYRYNTVELYVCFEA